MQEGLRLGSLVTFILIVNTQLNAQSIEDDVVEWTADHLFDLRAHVDTSYHCKFITYRQERLEWVQNDYVVVMPILSSEGEWHNLEADGIYIFNVRLKDMSGKIVFARVSGEVQVRMEFLEGSSNSLPFLFNISEINKR
jgi:hypothetical protein